MSSGIGNRQAAAPDSTAVRVALWRALHVEIDAPPHVLDDRVGLKLIAPDEGWRDRPDMHPDGTRPLRLQLSLPFLPSAARTSPLASPYFLSFFTPAEIIGLVREAGFRDVQHVSAAELGRRYFAARTDGLRPPNNTEELLVVTAG